MRRLLYGLLLVLLFITVPAFAATAFPCADNQTSCDPYAPDEGIGEDMGYKGPAPVTCEAWKSKGQRCRDCQPVYLNNGQPAGYDVCAYVDRNASCSCDFTNGCEARGTCTYRWY